LSMKSFEAGPSPEQIKSEEEMSLELPKEGGLEMRETVVEKAELKPEQAIAQERSVLERFKGKAKQVASVLLFVSALSVGPGMVSEAYAQGTKLTTRTEQVRKQEKTKTREGAPEWVARAISGEIFWEEGETIFAVGIVSRIQNISLLRSTAGNRARANLLKAASREKGTLKGSTVLSFWKSPDGTMFALARVSKSDISND